MREAVWVGFVLVVLVFALPGCASTAASPDPDWVGVMEHADGSATLKLSPEQWAACHRDGGCTVITKQALRDFATMICKRGCDMRPGQTF